MGKSSKEGSLITRARLLDSAEMLFATEGVEHVSLLRIACHAGLTRGALYWHFDNKNALLAAMFERGYARIATRIEAFSERISTGVLLEDVQGFCLQLVEEPFVDTQTMRFFVILLARTEMTEQNALAIGFRHAVDSLISVLRTALDRAIGHGVLPSTLDSRCCAHYIHGQIVGALILTLDTAPRTSARAVARATVSAALTALTCPSVLDALSTTRSTIR
ncbi:MULTISPECIES: TetR family transcriptional regulator [Burkholderiaceae]|jgi:AcrR family transcriptional regulator